MDTNSSPWPVRPLYIVSVLAGIFIAWNICHGIYFAYMPHDEALFRMLSRSIERTGWPTRPDGALYTVNQPLAIYVQAAMGTLFGLELIGNRMVHWLFYVLPMVGITMLISRELFGKAAAAATIIIFSGLAFFLHESIATEIDWPLTCFYTLALYLTIKWQAAPESDRHKLEFMLGGVVALVMCIKFFQGLVLVPSIGCVLLLEYRKLNKPLFLSCARIFLLAMVGPVLWVIWSLGFGADVGGRLGFLVKALVAGDERYAAISADKNIVTYFIFLVSYISIPLFMAAFGSLFFNRADWRRLAPPVIWVFWVLVAISLSKIRVARYFDPALPATVVLASGLVSTRMRELAGGFVSSSGWIIAAVVIAAIYFVAVTVDRSIGAGGFSIELYKVLFLGIVGVGAALFFLKKNQQAFVATVMVLLLFAGHFLFSLTDFPITRFSEKDRARYQAERDIGLEVQKHLPEEAILATTSMVTAYYADRDYFHLQPRKAASAVETMEVRDVRYLLLRMGDEKRFRKTPGFVNYVNHTFVQKKPVSEQYILHERQSVATLAQ